MWLQIVSPFPGYSVPSKSSEKFRRSSSLPMKRERRGRIILEEKSDNFNANLKAFSRKICCKGTVV